MRTKTFRILFLSIAATALITSCKHSGGGSFQTDATTGVTYRFINHNDNGTKATDSSFAKLVISYYLKSKTGDSDSLKTKDGKDSILFNSHSKGARDTSGTVTISLKKTFNGCLEQGVMMMSPGDSAQFEINADSLYVKTFHFPADRVPPTITPSTIYLFSIKLVSLMTKKDMMDEQMKQRQKMMEKIMAMKPLEAPAIADYLKRKHYESAPHDKDSIFTLEIEKKGKGKLIEEGDSIEVGYVGYLLNDTIFDRSDKGPNNGTFKLQYSKQAHLIQGWINVLGTMNEGEKVKVLIPSAMAYGMRGQGQLIQPFTPLVFEIQVVSVKKNK